MTENEDGSPQEISDTKGLESTNCPSSEAESAREPADPYPLFKIAMMTAMVAVATVKAMATRSSAGIRSAAATKQTAEKNNKKYAGKARIEEYLQILGARPTRRTLGINLEIEDDEVLARRQKWGTLLIVFAFIIAFTSGIVFLYAYWFNLSNQVLGSSLAFCLGGFGAIAVLYAHWMIRDKKVVAEREELASSAETRDDVFRDYSVGAAAVQRRGMLKWMAAASVALFASMGGSLVRSLGSPPGESLYTTVWKRGQLLMTIDGKPLTVHSLKPGDMAVVFPKDSLGDEKSQTTLIRVEEDLLRLPKGRENWAPKGYLAYSRVCTHAGCSVALFEAHTNQLLCPCHQSTFAVLRGAIPTSGPAARPLPQLPLYVDSNGFLRAGGGFTAPPGPGFTGMPA